MACKHCISDGMCDIKKEHPVTCWYINNNREQNHCYFYAEEKAKKDFKDKNIEI